MGFGAPWILWALAAIAIPVIIHLFYFRRYKKVLFSNIQFLQEATVDQKKSGRLKHLLILLCRILAVIFLVLAFALPFFGGNDTQKAPVSRLLIYIDNTFSMSQIDNNRSLLDEAKSIALAIVENLDDEQQVMILTNDAGGGQKSFYLPSEAKKIIEDIRLSPSAQSIENWNLNTEQLMRDIHIQDVKAVYISDFQKNSLPEKWDSVFVSTTLVPLGRKQATNISIDSLYLADPILHQDAPNQLIVKVKNQGAAISTQLHLTIQGEITGMKEVELPENGTLTDTLSFHTKGQQWVRGKVTIQDVQMEFDNSLYFSVESNSHNKVLLIEEVSSPKTVFQVFQSDPHFIVTRQHPSSAAVTNDYSLVVLNETSRIPAALEQQIIDFVQKGGNLYIVPSTNNASEIYRSLLRQLSVGQYAEKRNQSLSVQEINEQEPVVSIAFEKLPGNLDLPKVQSYWTISSSYRVPESSILKFENGRPFIQKYQVEKGLVYLQASSLDVSVNDFSSKTIFAPVVYNFAVVKSRLRPLYYTIGQKQLVSGLNISATNNDVLKMTNGQYEIIPPIFPMGQQISIEIPRTMERDGVYDIWRADQLVTVIACNFDRKESEMKFATAEELKTKYAASYILVENPRDFLQKNSGGILKSHTSLWKVCVILALIFLIAEILLIRFSTHKTSS